MRIIQLYCCEECSYQTTNRDECLAHEANHFGLTLPEYENWKRLSRAAEYAGNVVGTTNNPKTRRDFHIAIRELVDFEKEHNLPDKRPSHF